MARRDPTGKEWLEAERIAARTLRKRYPALGDRADELAKRAVEDAAGAWKGEAKFSTLATTIAMRKAAKLAAKELKAKAPPKPRPRRELRPGEAKALAPVLKDFFEHEGMMVEALLWQGGLGRYLAAQIQWFLPHLYESHHVPERFRPSLRVDAALVSRVDAYVSEVKKLTPEGWIESDETLFVRPKVAGRPPPDPYLEGKHGPELQRIFREQARRNAGYRFHEKRELVADAVVRFALECAGLSRTLQNKIMSPVRAAKAKAKKRQWDAAVRAVEEARKKGS